MRVSVRTLAVLGAVALFAAALWVLVGTGVGNPVDGSAPDADRTDSRTAPAGVAFDAIGGRARTGSDPADRDAPAVTGIVIDGDGQPVDGGSLELTCLRDGGATDALGAAVGLSEEGRFTGPGCAGRVCAHLHHATMTMAEPWMLDPGREATLRARILPRLHGLVLDPDGDPVAGARLVIRRPADADADDALHLPVVPNSTTTDADGRFSLTRIEVPPCGPCDPDECKTRVLPTYARVTISARADGFGPGVAEVEVETADDDNPAIVTLTVAAAPIRGTLRDPDGEPYPRSYILARSVARPAELIRVGAEDGTFTVGGLGDGAYDLRALADGVLLVGHRGAVPGTAVTLRGDRPAAGPALTVAVVDGAGTPIRGLSVDGGPFRGARTDMQGQVRIGAAIPGTYNLRIGGADRETTVVAIDVQQGESQQIARIELQAGG